MRHDVVIIDDVGRMTKLHEIWSYSDGCITTRFHGYAYGHDLHDACDTLALQSRPFRADYDRVTHTWCGLDLHDAPPPPGVSPTYETQLALGERARQALAVPQTSVGHTHEEK